ncbi:MAG: N-acetylmuramoyl-L-alanine amidase [bacterium]|nr:MAG: N-acetylmuramoyl-L-alanine amidase [bacterium]
MLRIYLLVLLFLTLFLIIQPLFGQEQGEFLIFDQHISIAIDVTETSALNLQKSILFESSPSERSTQLFQRILMNGIISDTNLTVSLRFENTEQIWSSWLPVYLKIFPNGRFWGRFDVETGGAQRIQLRINEKGAQLPVQIEIFAIEGIATSELKLSEDFTGKVAEKLKFSPLDTLPKPPLVTRLQWGANPPIGAYIPHDPYRLTQHHTAGVRVSTLQQGIAEMQFIQNFHQVGRGWQDIGYHFCIDDSGRLYEGVPPDYRGTHVGNNNTGNIGISYMGNLHEPGELPTDRALQSLVDMWSWLALHYGINPDSLFGHRNYNATACPGDNLYSELPDLRTGIRNKLGFGAPYIADPFPQPFSTEIPPNTPIQLFVRDDVEGVDQNSIMVRINGDTINPMIFGTAYQYQVVYQPPNPFPYSQNVIVDVFAEDLATPANMMSYSYQFKIEVEALHIEVETANSVTNGSLQLSGTWQNDWQGVSLPGLISTQRLWAVDTNGSHLARIYPEVSESGDYNIFMASADNFLGESARYRFINEDGSSYPHFAEYNGVYLNTWGLLSPTPVYFSSESGASGYIELSSLNDLDTRLVLDALRLEKVDRLDPPHQPILKWVRVLDRVTRAIEIAWYPSLEGDIEGYRLYMSEDALNWGLPLVEENILTADVHSFQYTYPDTHQSVYFRVVAVDTNKFFSGIGNEEPLLSEPSDAYGVGFSGNTPILVVDNFDRQASWNLPYHPFVASHGEALKVRGHGFDSCTETAVQNGDIALTNYEVVIYFCGDDSRSDESLAAADQWRLLNYLEGGGKLFISGSELGYDFAATTTSELNRYEYLLRTQYLGDLAGSNRVLGTAGTVFEGLDFIYGTQTGPNLYIEDYPDYIIPQFGGETALFYDNLRIAGVMFTGTYGNSSQIAQVVYLGFTFETIVSPYQRSALIGRVLTYFGLPVSIDRSWGNITSQFVLQQNYPNPFNPKTMISYEIPQHLNNYDTRLEIYNTLGQKIRTLVDEKKNWGNHRISWDGKDDHSVAVASGVYIYQLRVGDLTQSRKMILLK